MSGYDLFLSPAMECVAFEHGRTGPATVGGEPIGDFFDDFLSLLLPVQSQRAAGDQRADGNR